MNGHTYKSFKNIFNEFSNRWKRGDRYGLIYIVTTAKIEFDTISIRRAKKQHFEYVLPSKIVKFVDLTISVSICNPVNYLSGQNAVNTYDSK